MKSSYTIIIILILISQVSTTQNVFKKPVKEISHDLSVGSTSETNTVNTASIKSVKPDFDFVSKRLSPNYELRGVWVSTVHRVDYPAQATTTPSVLKAEWLRLLQFYKSLNLNAVIVQIRPTADAIYPSKLVPYAKWLTGKSGKPLQGNFDLLKFMIETSHKEGMEFHAWVNPYRVFVDDDTLNIAPNHIFRTHREWVLKYGKEHHLNPGIPEVWQHIADVVEEVVKKYDIDAIHFDDYFYPYRIAGEPLKDYDTFLQYGNAVTTIEDWRRANTDSMMYNVRRVIKKYKPYVQLGVSPFSVWKNKNNIPVKTGDTEGSETKAFQTCYGDLYADVLSWLKKGYLDYVAPEVYFHIGHPLVDYSTIVDWWLKNSNGTTVYISHAIYKVNNQEKYPEWRDPSEIPRQLDYARSKTGVRGLVFFSSRWLLENQLGVTDNIRNMFFYKSAMLNKRKY
jgi:uncharacterized lipoprotein YddW (UPF0748 family)